MKNKDFATFIISHGRPDNVITYNTLIKSGYTGKIYIIIDNEDSTSDQYYKNYGKKVILFDKKKIADTIDEGDNFDNRRTTTHARNACFDIAEKLGITYFLVLDDDYTHFYYSSDAEYNYRSDHKSIKDINKIIDTFFRFYNSTSALSICFAQGGDFIGGCSSSVWKKKMARKAMNSFFCSTKRKFQFISRLNEDVNTYMTLGSNGMLFLTLSWIRLEQKRTQDEIGGMTDAYIDGGTYVKSFYTVMYCPSFCKVALMGDKNQRLHHRISWSNAVPVILDEKYKK